jgi:rSAM/selenodomain-associated transferase 2
MNISIIIPVLNEREELPRTHELLTAMPEAPEIIAVDGGSTDGTLEWLRKQSSIKTIEAQRGRGGQLNAGAAASSGDVLLFLHADCVLPSGALSGISDALEDSRVAGGCFLVRFGGPRLTSLRLVEGGINMRTQLARTATGDQAIFVRRTVFEAVRGFSDWPLFEDVDLLARIKHYGRFVVLPSKVTISPRRWVAKGVWRTTFLMYALRLGYHAGIPPATLHRWFGDVRPHLWTPDAGGHNESGHRGETAIR